MMPSNPEEFFEMVKGTILFLGAGAVVTAIFIILMALVRIVAEVVMLATVWILLNIAEFIKVRK